MFKTLQRNPPDLSRTKILLIALAVEGFALLLAVVLAYWFRIDLWVRPRQPVTESLVAGLATVPPLLLFVAAMSERAARLRWARSLRNTVLIDIRALFSSSPLLDLLLISIAAGIAEELLFRGVIQSQLGLLTASLLFGLIHFVTPTYAVVATLMGFYIGVVFMLSDSLFVVICLHALYDFLALAYIRYFPAGNTGRTRS